MIEPVKGIGQIINIRADFYAARFLLLNGVDHIVEFRGLKASALSQKSLPASQMESPSREVAALDIFTSGST